MRPLLLACLLLFPLAATAQERIPSHCVALAQATPGVTAIGSDAMPPHLAAPLGSQQVRIHYVDHSTFLIQSAGGLTAATDYFGRLGTTALVPDIVTMNNAHRTHWTPTPDPRIPHVLRGWGEGTLPADHHLDLGEMLVRNVTTDILRSGLPRPDGNSIFVFELAGLCIGHLGHLHHEPTPAQYAMIGRLDVVMVPVDGGMTLDSATLERVVGRFRSSIVLPMHWFSGASLQRFLTAMAGEFDIRRPEEAWIEVSLQTLPSRPTIIVLPPRWLED